MTGRELPEETLELWGHCTEKALPGPLWESLASGLGRGTI